MDTQRLEIDNGRGQMLSARLDRPLRDGPVAYALFAHCFTCSKNLRAAVELSRSLVDEGWAVLRFDFTGLGDSEGEFEDTHFSSNVADLVAVGQWLAREHGGPHLLIGHSLGGAAVLRASEAFASNVAVATLGAPADPQHVTNLLTEQRKEIEERGEAEVRLGDRRFTIKKSFLEDIAEQPMKESIANLRRALLVMHAPLDQTVGIDNAARIFTWARHPKSFVSLDDTDHLLTRPRDARFAARIIAAWATRYLPEPQTEDAAEAVTAWGPRRKFRTELTVGEHVMLADEPAPVGGDDSGPSPYGFLMAGLGACTAMTLRMYADRKKWPLRQAVVHLTHDKVHADDCSECEKTDGRKAGRIDRIERTIELRGDLTEEQRSRLIEIADRCPVHRTLEQRPVIVTRQPSSSSPRDPPGGS